MTGTSHLHATAVALLSLSDEDRIIKIQSDRWIGYPLAKKVLDRLEELLTYPTSTRMPNMLIVGDTNNGKTTLLNRFCLSHPAGDNPEGDAISAPVVYVDAPSTANEDEFYSSILDFLFAPYRPSAKASDKKKQVITILKNIGTKILIIDEIQHLLTGPSHRRKSLLNGIKLLGNHLKIPIVVAGMPESFRVIQSESQLANRFTPFVLPLWKDDKQFRQLLASFECLLPLQRPSKLYEGKMATRLYAMTDGYIGEVSNLLKIAGKYAVESSVERIDDKVLDSVEWYSPSERKRIIDRGI